MHAWLPRTVKVGGQKFRSATSRVGGGRGERGKLGGGRIRKLWSNSEATFGTFEKKQGEFKGSHFKYFVHLPDGWGVLKAGGFQGEPNRGRLDLCRFLERVRVIEAGRNSGGGPSEAGGPLGGTQRGSQQCASQ